MNKTEKLITAYREIVDEIEHLLIHKNPIVVALDGGSGAGKSTLAAFIAGELKIALIPLDDFFSADIPDQQWDEFTVEQKLKSVFDWKRLRTDVIEPLLQGTPARWYVFDFASQRSDGTYPMQTHMNERNPAPIILIEGAYSASPELADLVDLAVLIDVPVEERHARLTAREDKHFLEKWHRRWDEVEAYYANQVRTKSSFDLVVQQGQQAIDRCQPHNDPNATDGVEMVG
jgi:uridine kinase